MLKTTTPCNRWMIFLSIPYPHGVTFCLVWQHHDVFHIPVTTSKRLRIGPKIWILLGLFEATCIINLLIVNKSKNLKSGTTWKRKSVLTLHFENYVTFILTTRNRVANFCDKHPKSKSCKLLFGWRCCFRAYRLITAQWNVKRIVPCKRWEI